jgi:hypothetical protein
LLKENLDKTARERVRQASRELLASIKARLAGLDRFWEKEQTKADIEVFHPRHGIRQPPRFHGSEPWAIQKRPAPMR